MTLYLFEYNNYYNRIVKRLHAIEDYGQEGILLDSIPNVNFLPNDGISTEHIINYDANTGNYVIITDGPNDEIISRWFVIDSVRVRVGQYKLILYRDVIADWYDEIVAAPMFIEKATLPYTSPLLFNTEAITVNQIKQKEILIADKSKTPWLVGYYTKGATLSGTVAINDNIDAMKLNVSNITDWEFYKYSTGNELPGPATSGFYKFTYKAGQKVIGMQTAPYTPTVEVNQFTGDTTIVSQSLASYELSGIKGNSAIEDGFVSYGLSKLNPVPYSNTASTDTINRLLSYGNQLVKTLDGKYYTITVRSSSKTNTVKIESGDLFNKLSTIAIDYIGLSGSPNANTFKYKFTAPHYTVSIKEETNLATTYNITTNRLITTDAPWDIFAIPLNSIRIIKEDKTGFITNNDIAINAAMAIQAQQASNVHDIQLLPYCPVNALISDDNEITLTDPTQYSYIKDKDQNIVGIIFNVANSRFGFNITDITDSKFTPAQNNIERKVRNECDKWRLVSPNYSNYFDFSVEKNNGISYFNVDCEYKPFTPYIHVNPNFSYLYGYDDNSPRGLILGGDFSLSQIIDQWQQYQIQNKNFQNIFDRQIQNMEVQHKYQGTLDVVNAITGTIGGGVQGAAIGGLKGGGPYGAAIGAVAGTVLSAAGGVADVEINKKLRSEAMDYTKDLFGYQLGNIQALPNTISKVSALNQNNKIYPILEYYTCTDEERKAFINKVAYNGMTVMVIGTIDDYINNTWTLDGISAKGYIKGKLIRLESEEDFHIVNTIAEELNKGVFIWASNLE